MSLSERPSATGRFDSLADLQSAHAGLVKEVGADVLAAENAARITDFVRRAAVTGALLDGRQERAAAQGLVNFWMARLSAATRGAGRKMPDLERQGATPLPTFEETLLEEFDPATVREAAAAADRWLATQPADDQRVARRVMLRLVRLAADKSSFEPLPTTRAALQDVDPSSERVDQVIAGLAAAGVVRLTKGASSDLDQVALRSADLIAGWPTFANWLKERTRFREQVEVWNRDGRPSQALLEREALEEVRSYHDRNDLERAFIEKSRYRELWVADRNRGLKVLFGVLAIAALLGLLVTGIFAWWAVTAERAKSNAVEFSNALIKEEARRESIRREAAEVKAASDGASMLTIALLLLQGKGDPEAAHLANKVMLVMTLGQVLFADDAEYLTNLKNWERLREQLKGEPFFEFFLTTHDKSIAEVTADTPVTDRKIKIMIRISKEIREAALRSQKALDILRGMKQLWYKQATEAADKLADAAADGKPLEEVQVYWTVFWRLYTCELILVENKAIEGAMVDFGKALRQWEHAGGGKAPPAVAKDLKGFAKDLRREFDEDLRNDPLSKKGVKP